MAPSNDRPGTVAWPEQRELQRRLRAAIGMRRPNGSLLPTHELRELWGEKQSTLERMLGMRPGQAKRPSLQQIKLLADEVGLPEGFFYADFARLDEIVPDTVKALLAAKRDELEIIERQQALLQDLYADAPEAEEIQQLVQREVERERARSQADGRTKRARKSRRDEER